MDANNLSTVTPEALVNYALQGITRRIQGADGILSYRFSNSDDPELTRAVERALLRVDAQFDIDLQRQCSCEVAEVTIVEFAGISGTDPVTGRTTWNVGKATPTDTSWSILWADKQDLTGVAPVDVIIHEWGHVLGLIDADSKDPLRTDSTSAETVMSYNRLKDSPGRYFTALDQEALTLLWGPETSAAEQRTPFVNPNSRKDASSFAWEVQDLIDNSPNNAEFVSAAYSTILERNVDAGGLSWWSPQLEQGLSRRAVVDTLLLSDEFLNILM